MHAAILALGLLLFALTNGCQWQAPSPAEIREIDPDTPTRPSQLPPPAEGVLENEEVMEPESDPDQ
ncbi:MAG: hypothetical protein KIT14_11510 [bacterium]|nr:hypothetical protein [bacterium]